ncbi:hypothetical protein RJZ57_000101 [Blastomyces gilchristii]
MQLLALSLLAASASVVDACVSDHLMDRSFDTRQLDLVKRDSQPPPPITENESILMNSFDNDTISDWLYYYTHGLHVAGTNKTMAQWTADKWTEFGVPSTLADYHVFLNYPVSSSLSLTLPDGTVVDVNLDEDVLEKDDTSSYPNRVPIFHGYSASGEAKAEFVYVGRGQQVDFDRLVELGVDLKGKIALSRYGGPFSRLTRVHRGLKVKNAQDYGMIACVIFTDPGDDGNVTAANGYVTYPDGPARNPSSVQRGSVLFLSTAPGDPTTPGYPSKEDSPRADTSPVVPKIPSLPISYANAQKILIHLDGHGQSADAVNRTKWVGGLDVDYSTGPAPGAELSVSNIMRDEVRPIYNPIGIINGTKQDEVIVIGNHWDAWVIGGAVDPNSGSAVMVELAKALGKLQETGWKPKRTIVLGSWDGEEYGLLGSTEWVEEYVNWLKETCVAYVNIDSAVSGPHPGLSGTPGLHELSIELMKKVAWPYKGDESLTMYDMWMANSKGRVNIGSSSGSGDPIYHYHSNYDSFYWMDTFGDPGFVFHKAMGQYLALLTYHLASDDIIPFEVNNYGREFAKYLVELKKTIESSTVTLDLSRLEAAIDVFNKAAAATTTLREEAIKANDARLVDLVNAKFRDFERGFVSQGGLPGRIFFKHLIWAPGQDTGYAPTTFPGITEAVQAGNHALAQEFVEKTSNAIYVAAGILTP